MRFRRKPEDGTALNPPALARYVIRGGNANTTTNAGPFYVNANNSVANANANIGGFGLMMARSSKRNGLSPPTFWRQRLIDMPGSGW